MFAGHASCSGTHVITYNYHHNHQGNNGCYMMNTFIRSFIHLLIQSKHKHATQKGSKNLLVLHVNMCMPVDELHCTNYDCQIAFLS
jgi:Golgi nucleoside diphosphatase